MSHVACQVKLSSACHSPTDVATLLRKGLGVSSAVLPTVAFVSSGVEITWMTAGPVAQTLSYTVGGWVGGSGWVDAISNVPSSWACNVPS
jgi:hypothetical protein